MNFGAEAPTNTKNHENYSRYTHMHTDINIHIQEDIQKYI